MHLLGVQEEDASLLGVPWSPEDSELRHSRSTRNRSLGSVASPTQPPAGEGETAHNERASSRAAGRVCRGEAQRGVRSLRPGPLPAFSGSQSPGHQQPSTVGEGPARVPSPSDLGLCPGRQLSAPRGRSGGARRRVWRRRALRPLTPPLPAHSMPSPRFPAEAWDVASGWRSEPVRPGAWWRERRPTLSNGPGPEHSPSRRHLGRASAPGPGGSGHGLAALRYREVRGLGDVLSRDRKPSRQPFTP